MDSRLTRLAFVDVGLWASPFDFLSDIDESSDDPADYVFLRHGIYVAPGIRIPHREKGSFSWDLIGRGGFAGVWSVDAHPQNFVPAGAKYEIEADPSLFLGANLDLRRNDVGVRLGAKGFSYATFDQVEAEDVLVFKTQFFAEAFYQW